MGEFKPTKLYIVWHRVTGLFYLGKTTRLHAKSYVGSGKYWRDHIRKHGKEHVQLVWSKVFTDPEFLARFALFMSEANDIVNSPNWANLKPESGFDGGYDQKHSPEAVERIRKALTGRKLPPETKARMSAALKGRVIGEEWRENLSKSKRGIPKSPEHRAKISAAKKGRQRTPEERAAISEGIRRARENRNEASERPRTSNQTTGNGV